MERRKFLNSLHCPVCNASIDMNSRKNARNFPLCCVHSDHYLLYEEDNVLMEDKIFLCTKNFNFQIFQYYTSNSTKIRYFSTGFKKFEENEIIIPYVILDPRQNNKDVIENIESYLLFV